MAQYARPDGDDNNDGEWETEAGNDFDLYAEINEAVADDSDFVTKVGDGANNYTVTFTLGNVTDPSSSSDHKVVVRALGDDGGMGMGGGPDLRIDLLEGSTSRANWTIEAGSGTDDLTTSAKTFDGNTLSTSEANSITDYTDLKLKLTLVTNGTGGETLKVFQAYFECPDAGGGGGGGGGGGSARGGGSSGLSGMSALIC